MADVQDLHDAALTHTNQRQLHQIALAIEPEHVLVDVRHRHDALLLTQLSQRIDSVAVVGGYLEIEFARRGAHALVERLPELVLATGEKEAHGVHLTLVFLAIDVQTARRGAALHLVLNAGPLAIGEFAVAARAQLEVAFHDMQSAARRSRRMIRAEVARAVGLWSANQL